MAPIGPRDSAPMPEWANWLPWVLTVAGFVGWAVQGVYGWWTARKLKKEIARLRSESQRISQRLLGAELYVSEMAHLMAPAVVAAGGATPARVVLPPLVVPGPGAEVSAPPYPADMSASALVDEWLRAIALCRSIISGPAG